MMSRDGLRGGREVATEAVQQVARPLGRQPAGLTGRLSRGLCTDIGISSKVPSTRCLAHSFPQLPAIYR